MSLSNLFERLEAARPRQLKLYSRVNCAVWILVQIASGCHENKNKNKNVNGYYNSHFTLLLRHLRYIKMGKGSRKKKLNTAKSTMKS